MDSRDKYTSWNKSALVEQLILTDLCNVRLQNKLKVAHTQFDDLKHESINTMNELAEIRGHVCNTDEMTASIAPLVTELEERNKVLTEQLEQERKSVKQLIKMRETDNYLNEGKP